MPPDRSRKARRLSMTPLIDIIFLLLLFFMLTSTFSKFADVPLRVGGTGGAAPGKQMFLRLGPEEITLNGATAEIAVLPSRITADMGSSRALVVVSTAPAVSAQRLTDLLVALRGIVGVDINVLGP